MTRRDIIILGSTGSVGTQAIDIVRANPDRFRVVGIGAGGSNPALLARQALDLGVAAVAVATVTPPKDKRRAPLELDPSNEDLLDALEAEASQRGISRSRLPEVIAGTDAMTELASRPADIVMNAITGSIGLRPTLAALAAGSKVALANKESLVAGGSLVRAAAGPDQIIPVDSEHSALAQAARAGRTEDVRRFVLTASGGPFRGKTRNELRDVTVQQAMAHPTWDMGRVITINSATLVNKGLEVIETNEFFGIPYDDISVVVHPQSVIHSMVEFSDGSTIAQASPPDMRLPIAHALAWPGRVPGAAEPIDWTRAHNWSFEPLDDEAFPAVALARHVGATGRCLPAVYNAANEECIAGFVSGALPFLGIVDTVSRIVSEAPGFTEPGTVEEVLEAELWARRRANELIYRVGQ